MIATLPMYDRAETATANDAFWAAIRAELGCGPRTLTRDADLWSLWQSPDLLLGQTCGLPYRARLHRQVQLVGTPEYAIAGCPPGYYRSVFIARDPSATLAALAGQRFAYNEPLSQSGWAAPALHLAEKGIAFGPLIETGCHRASALAVLENRADFAALDALTWALIEEHDSFAAELHVVAATAPTPGLPLITAPGNDVDALRRALAAAIDAITPQTRRQLHLHGLALIPASAYLALPMPPPPAP